MTSLRLIFLPDDPQAETQILELGEAGPQRLAWSDASPGLTPDATVAVVPGAQVRACWLDLPDVNLAQLRGAAAFALEGELAQDLGQAHLAIGERDSEGRRLVAIASDGAMRGWLTRLGDMGLRPDLMVPDYCLLPAPERDGEVVTAMLGPQMAARGERLGVTAEPELVQALIAGRRQDHLPPEALDLILADGVARAPVNLLQGVFASNAGAARPAANRRLVWLAVLLLISPLVILAAQAWRLDNAADRLDAETRARAIALMPGAARFEQPADYVIGRLKAEQSRARFTILAANFYTALESVESVKLDTLVYAEGDVLRTSVGYANYSDMDLLRSAAGKAGLTLTEESTLTEGGRITSDLIVRSRP